MSTRTPLALGLTLSLLAASAGGATAAKLVTGAQIKDGSITGRDIRNRSVSSDKLS